MDDITNPQHSEKITTIKAAIAIFGGYVGTSKVCGVSDTAVAKWDKNGKLPRTELTGETRYAEKMAKVAPQIDAEALKQTAKVTRQEEAA